MEKIYAIRFCEYTSCMEDAVWDEINNTYIDVPTTTNALIKESDLEKYKPYGKGYESIKLVGCLVEE